MEVVPSQSDGSIPRHDSEKRVEDEPPGPESGGGGEILRTAPALRALPWVTKQQHCEASRERRTGL